MGFKALTVNTPVEEPAHILAEDDATLYGAVIGGDCVLPVGSQFSAKVTSNNNVRLSDGMVLVGGHVGRIVKGDYEDMVIENGVSGQNRNDLIVARFISGGTSGADDYRLVVIKGTPGATANDPAAVKGDLYAGEKQRDYPLWRVRLTGLSIAGVDKLFTIGRMMPDKLDKTGDASKVTNIFTQAGSRNNLESGEKLSVSLGKIMKWFTDIHNALFGNIIKTSDGKAGMTSDGEGGNFWFVSPKGVRWEMDAAVNEGVRFFNYETMGGFTFDKQGNMAANDMLLTESNRWASDWIVHLENLYNQLNSSLSAKNKNNLGGAVDLAGIGGNTYTFPADGYLYLKANYTRGCYVKANVIGHNGANYFTVAVGSVEPNSGWNTVTNNTETVYVRAGMLVNGVQIGGNNNKIVFIPLQ